MKVSWTKLSEWTMLGPRVTGASFHASRPDSPWLALENGDPIVDEEALGTDGPDAEEWIEGGCSKDWETEGAGEPPVRYWFCESRGLFEKMLEGWYMDWENVALDAKGSNDMLEYCPARCEFMLNCWLLKSASVCSWPWVSMSEYDSWPGKRTKSWRESREAMLLASWLGREDGGLVVGQGDRRRLCLA